MVVAFTENCFPFHRQNRQSPLIGLSGCCNRANGFTPPSLDALRVLLLLLSRQGREFGSFFLSTFYDSTGNKAGQDLQQLSTAMLTARLSTCRSLLRKTWVFWPPVFFSSSLDHWHSFCLSSLKALLYQLTRPCSIPGTLALCSVSRAFCIIMFRFQFPFFHRRSVWGECAEKIFWCLCFVSSGTNQSMRAGSVCFLRVCFFLFI